MSIKDKAKKLAGGLLFGHIAISVIVLFVAVILLIPVIFTSYLFLEGVLTLLAKKNLEETNLRLYFPKIGLKFSGHFIKKMPEIGDAEQSFYKTVKNSVKLIVAIPKVFVLLLKKGLEATG